MKTISVYGEDMISVDDAEEMIEEAFDAGRGLAPTSNTPVGCAFSFRTLGDIQRLAEMFDVPEIRTGDVFEFGASGIQRVIV